MVLKRQKNWISSVIMMMVLMGSTTVQATSDFQIWIPININVKLTEQLRGFFELQPRIGNDASNLTTMQSLGQLLAGRLMTVLLFGLAI